MPNMQDLGVRQFLLTNLDRATPADPYHFRIPIDFLQNAIGEIGAFPYTPGERVYDKPSLFLKGPSLFCSTSLSVGAVRGLCC